MERRSFLNGRFSLSTSNLSGTPPVAESTQISHLQQKFPWGDGALNSSEKYIQNDVVKRTIVLSKAGLREKKDPRTFTDIQSKGLTSRIVKYHGNNSKLNSSLSMNNLYNKPGHFPVVHLKKQKEISYNLNKKNLSMVRIAPPEKSVFQANTRSSILRSGSIVSTIGFQKSGDEVSRENRPILHPAVENEIAPTRSVLDDLKEISRKRINSDVLDGNDSLKKYCKELEVSPAASPIIQQTSVPCTLYAAGPTKRQREIALTTTGNQKSPEQLGIKRRMYSSINNDITSSLSSSLNILSAKTTCPLTNTKKLVAEHLPIPNTEPLIKSNSSINAPQNAQVLATESESNKTCHNGETLRTMSEPILSTRSNNKPKLTLFNKNYETALSKEYMENIKNNSKEEFNRTCFVKPKPNTVDSNNIGLSENSLIARTQKSKLALMLSGLSGDLNSNSEDDIDSGSKFNNEIENNAKPISVIKDSASSSQTTLTFGTSTTVATKIISSPTTANSNGDKRVEKSTLSPAVDNNSSTINITTNIVPSIDLVKQADVTKSNENLIPNKNDVELNKLTTIDSLNKLRKEFAINKVPVSSIITSTSPIKNIVVSADNISKTSLNVQLTNKAFIPAVGIENKITSDAKDSEKKHILNNNFVPHSDLSQQKLITIRSNSPHVNNTNLFQNNPKTTSSLATSFNLNNTNASNMFMSNLAAKPTESNNALNESTLINRKILGTSNLFPIGAQQKTFIIPETSSKNEIGNSFRPVNNNNNILSTENTFTNCLPNDVLSQNLVKPIVSDVISNTENKILPSQSSANQFSTTPTNLNLSVPSSFSFKPVVNAPQPNVNTNIFGASNTSNIFAFGSNTKEGVLPLGTNATNKFTFSAPNTQFGSNKSFSFDEKKATTGPLNNIGSNKIELNKSSTLAVGSHLLTTNQFSVGTKNNSEILSPFAFRENNSQRVNSTLNRIAPVDKPFSFSNLNTKKEAAFSFSGNGEPNQSNNVYKGEVPANPTITNLFNPVSPSPPANDRLIRKATRRLHK